MSLLEGRYLEIYDIINKDFSKLTQYEDIVKFKDYFSNLDKIKQFCVIEKEIKRKINLLEQFYEAFQNIENFDYIQTENILFLCKPLYELIKKVHSFPDFLIKKFYQDFDDLSTFKMDYERLRLINSENSSTREIRVERHVNILNRPKRTRINENRDNYYKNQNKLIQEVRSFNYLPLSEMVLFKNDYSGVYEIIIKDFSKFSQYEDVIRFKEYYYNLDKIKQICEIEEEIKRKSDLLDEFDKCFWDIENYDYKQTGHILISSKPLYELIKKIHLFPDFLIKKFYQEFENLTNFKEYYEELEIINSDTPVTREIRVRMHVDKVKRLKYARNKSKRKNHFINQTYGDAAKSNNINKHENENNAQSKNPIDMFLKKVKSFNISTFSEMILLEEEYSGIFDGLQKDSSMLSQFEECIIFMNYFSHLDEIKQIASLEEEIKTNANGFIQFEKDLKNNGYLTYAKRKKIIDQYKPLYELTSKLDIFSDFLVKKVYQENDYLDCFNLYYEDLIHYKNLSDEKPNKIKEFNENRLDEEIDVNKEFFDDITDINKKRAIVIDEKNVKVIAGAGTGKTFTLQKKVNYLTKKLGISPKKILCLCYTIKGAEDLNKKVNNGRDEENKVEACTFHEFCRRVASDCDIEKGRTDRKLLKRVIRNYSEELVDDDKLTKLIDYFSYYINPPADEKEYGTYDELLIYEQGRDLKTLKNKYYESGVTTQTMNGEIVDSIGELIIANYLFMHEIEYEYNEIYKFNLADMIEHRFLDSGKYFSICNLEFKGNLVKQFIDKEKEWIEYYPDFYIPERNVYLEHFGIGRSNNEKWLGENYEKEMEEKIEFHKEHGTKLLKTYYYNLAEGKLIEELKELLEKNYVTIGQMDRKHILEVLRKTNKIEDFENFNKLIESFINIFEAQNRLKMDFNNFKHDNKSVNDGYKRKRQELFLDIVSDVYDSYYELNEGKRIDNNREVSLALELIQKGRYSASYEYILIDEYQDINPIRSLLLQELQRITNAKLFVVGDDWQSIYRFNGSEMRLFINFDESFPNSEVIKITENRRNYPQINKVASDFIKKNEDQEKKELKSKKPFKYGFNPIRIIQFDYNPNNNKVLKLHAIIERIIKLNPKKEKTKILILGRNNNDIYKFAKGNNLFELKEYSNISKVVCKKYSNLNITFMTIHKSKGLEYDEVIVISFENKLNGFPNKIEDDSVLSFLKKQETFAYAEERRLLYVALTRTLNSVYLLAPTYQPSIFIDELINEHNVKVLPIRVNKNLERDYYNLKKSNDEFECKTTDIVCPKCGKGNVVIMKNNSTGKMFIRCSTDPVPNTDHYSGGPYWGYLDDYIYAEKCPNPDCEGILIKGFSGDSLICSLNRQGCKETKKLDYL